MLPPHALSAILSPVTYHVILAGDLNEVMDPILDKSRSKGPPRTKDREVMHMIKEDMGLTDI